MHVKTTPSIPTPPSFRYEALDRIAASVVASGAAPAACCVSGFFEGDRWYWGTGAAGTLWPFAATPANPDTVFDLASLTKSIVAIAAATEFAHGRLSWRLPLKGYLPELEGTPAAEVTIEMCLSHRAGFLPHVELYRHQLSGRATSISRAFGLVASSMHPSLLGVEKAALYSDLGYILVGAAIERHLSMSLDDWVTELLALDALGSSRQWLASGVEFRGRCAPTEVIPWRGGLIQGQVHDENAWLLTGHKASGHAGFFGTAIGVARFVAGVLDASVGRPSQVPRAAALETLQRRPGGTLRAGFDGKAATGSTAGESAGPESFGHLGFTGTSFWCDPERAIVVVLLTNRVCPTRNNIALRKMRATLHHRLFDWAETERSRMTGLANRARCPSQSRA